MKGVKVTAFLRSPLAGDPPMLDGILFGEMLKRGVHAERLRSTNPCHGVHDVHIPVKLCSVHGHPVPMASSPILFPQCEHVEHLGKRLGIGRSSWMGKKKRLVVSVGNSTYKSYRMPLMTQRVERVVWFAVSKRRPVKKLLRSVHSIGKKRTSGYGVVDRWLVETVDDPPVLYAQTDQGRILMRPLPADPSVPRPDDEIGARLDFGAVSPPYWHPDRSIYRMVPV